MLMMYRARSNDTRSGSRPCSRSRSGLLLRSLSVLTIWSWSGLWIESRSVALSYSWSESLLRLYNYRESRCR